MTVMNKTVAILGASNNRGKFGNKGVRAFLKAGWTVYPVNPAAQSIEGLKCYPSITEVPGPLDRVSLYLPPGIGLKVLAEVARKNPGEVFLNPGADDGAVLAEARRLGLSAVTACSIVDLGFSPAEFPDHPTETSP